jgi:hypothetical protein
MAIDSFYSFIYFICLVHRFAFYYPSVFANELFFDHLCVCDCDTFFGLYNCGGRARSCQVQRSTLRNGFNLFREKGKLGVGHQLYDSRKKSRCHDPKGGVRRISTINEVRNSGS